MISTELFCDQDAVEKQPDQWKKDHLCPAQLKNDPDALCLYRDAVGELLNYQRSNLRTLVSHSISHSTPPFLDCVCLQFEL
jgi:hypothetical protein